MGEGANKTLEIYRRDFPKKNPFLPVLTDTFCSPKHYFLAAQTASKNLNDSKNNPNDAAERLFHRSGPAAFFSLA
jgi:hypothetical protein